ncbi:phosphatase PAP2 family protein [Sporosarcina sp. ACRSL]|uniref:phosphatase PAP2 family protein n=1 Tax=Sporosarcina sp. ACRSL TaxID=2918215 RepID=UPI001EF54CD0|nr:phosphatase PAP2 family protein [Sporosarcina sp. ACRSL]MCG7343431.1 phosphatase PAP2 family protein [Sporosarcina sp. ACRSL]
MKNSTIRPSVAIGLCILFGGAYVFIVLAIISGMTWGFDKSVIDAIQGLEAPWLTSIMIAFTFIGSTKVVMLLTIAMTILLVWKFRARSQAYFFFFVMVGTIIAFQTLKVIYKRDRPEFHRLAEAGGYSFPSGHAMMATSLYALLTYMLWRHIQSTAGRIALLSFAIFMFGMISLSRIYLGVHYPSDILGGLFASAFWVALTTFLFVQFQKRKERSLVQD